MSGVVIVSALLVDNAAALGVDATRIMGGGLEQGITLPALLVTSISVTADHAIRGQAQLLRERVQVTIQANAYAEQKAIEAAVRRALDGWSGQVVGLTVLDIEFNAGGPDFLEEPSIWMGSADFRVTFRP